MTITINRHLFFLIFLFVCIACQQGQDLNDAIFQRSTIDALLAGRYDDTYTFGSLKQMGDFGIGTFNSIDGEMLALDGVFYQCRTDGKTYPVADEGQTPFATVKFFQTEEQFNLTQPFGYDDLKRHLDEILPSQNHLYAIKIYCNLDSILFRSVPKQQPPYEALATVIADEVKFSHQNIHGTLVGFRFPPYLQGVNVPGYHFHFISEDRKVGGHVLDLLTRDGTIYSDQGNSFLLSFPDDDVFTQTDLSIDRSEDLEKVETR